MSTASATTIIGRFAPSPTGPLHFGSLVTALASYLNIKHQRGKWLVRIEDIDPPREVPGSRDSILRQLEQHGLAWDDHVIYQSAHLERYRDIIQQFQDRNLTYHCQCNRKRLNGLSGVYDGKCSALELSDQDTSLRLASAKALSKSQYSNTQIGFTDQVMAEYSQHIEREIGDFILRRRDGLVSYHLAVVVDDQDQGISEVLRGADLLDSTPKQILLQQCLGFRIPTYIHIPMALNKEGQKLSKQTHAKALIDGQENQNLWLALNWLQQKPPVELKNGDISEILSWGIKNWDLSNISASIQGIPAPDNF